MFQIHSKQKCSSHFMFSQGSLVGKYVTHDFPTEYWWWIAASHYSFEPPNIEASQVLDVAVCHCPFCMLPFNDNITNSWNVSQLGQLDIFHHSQHLIFCGNVFIACLLPRLCKGAETTQATCKVYMHQRDSFLQLLAGLCFIFTFWQDVKSRNHFLSVHACCPGVWSFAVKPVAEYLERARVSTVSFCVCSW